jgi:hypothetical protein
MDADADKPLRRGLVEVIEDRIAMMFYRTLYRAPATLLAVKHSFYFNETYGEAPQDRVLLDRVEDVALRQQVEAHLDDEVRHAALWCTYLTERGEMPASEVLPFGDFVGMLRAAQWLPSSDRLRQPVPLSALEQMTFFAIIHVIETQAVRQMVLFREVVRERGDHALDNVISSILKDEGRHMRYSKQALHDMGAQVGDAATARRLERIAQRAFVPSRVPNPDGVGVLDAARWLAPSPPQ